MLGTVDPGRATRILISVPLCAVLSASRGPRDPSQTCRHSWLVYLPPSSRVSLLSQSSPIPTSFTVAEADDA